MRAITDKKLFLQKISAGAFVVFTFSIVLLSAVKRDSLIYFLKESSRISSEIFFVLPETEHETNSPPQTAEEETTEALPTEKKSAEETAYHKYSLDEQDFISGENYLSPSSQNEDVYSDSPDTAETSFSDDSFEAGGKIISEYFGKGSGEDYIDLRKGGQIRNLTSLSQNELISLSEEPLPFEIKGDGTPEILIMHTHTTECYEDEEREFYDLNRASRILDEKQNMVAVGNAIADEIVKCGIGVIHDTTVHDYPDYNGSYDRSRETVLNIIRQYPTIKIILDIHRDAIERGDERVAAVTEINGKKAAQIMIICGADDGTMDMPNFRKNLIFASALESALESDNPTLTRPLLFDYRHYNQDISAGSLLIEVGSHANTLTQAKYSAKLIGQTLGKMFKKEKE